MADVFNLVNLQLFLQINIQWNFQQEKETREN